MVSSICLAQYSNHQLYQAYLTRDMNVWKQHIAITNWDSITAEEKKQLLNYEYGFTAYSISQGAEDVEAMIQQYEQHLQDAKIILEEGVYLAYQSGLYTYKLALDNSQLINYGRGIYDNIKQAMKLAPNNPFVLSMQGNVEFYSPFGNKKRALEYYVKADSIYRAQGTTDLWNVRAVQMTLVQCLDKLGRKEEAASKREEYLREEPNLKTLLTY